jgi:hypothetical protein
MRSGIGALALASLFQSGKDCSAAEAGFGARGPHFKAKAKELHFHLHGGRAESDGFCLIRSPS